MIVNWYLRKVLVVLGLEAATDSSFPLVVGILYKGEIFNVDDHL